jgi:hypothetical protein
MAKARMLSVKAGSDPDLNSMSVEAELVFVLTIAHLDRDGLIIGDPIPLWGKVIPRRVELMDRMSRIMQEWVEHNLVVRYAWKDGALLFFKGFRKHNINMAYEREPESDFPPPPGFHRVKNIGLIPNDPETAGRLAETLGERSKYCAALTEASLQPMQEIDISLHVNYMENACNLHDEVEVELQQEVEVEVENNNNVRAAQEAEKAVVVALQAFGISEGVAKGLVVLYGAEKIQQKIAYVDFLRIHDPGKVRTPRGWLRRAIEDDYGPPDGFAAALPAKRNYRPDEYADIILGAPTAQQLRDYKDTAP